MAAYQPVHRLSRRQVEDLHRMYQDEWWTAGRELKDIRRMLEHSQVIVGFAAPETGELAAFARCLTDYVYKALVLDVIVERRHRGRGLGAALIERLLDHPELSAVQHFELYCLLELVPFYRRWGFTTDLGTLRFMRRYAV